MSNQNDPNVQAANINSRGTIIAAIIGALITSLLPSLAGVIVNIYLNKETSKTIQGVKNELEDIKSSGSIHPFRAATYEDKKQNKYEIIGPSPIPDREDRTVKRQMWTVKSESSQFTASWISGEPNKGHPTIGNREIGNREIASFLPGKFTYGVVGNSAYNVGNTSGKWSTGQIIGVQQDGNELKITKFYESNNTIRPLDTLTLTLIEQD